MSGVSFDYLVSPQQQPGRNFVADCLRRPEIDDQLKLRRLLYRDVGKFDAAQELDKLSGLEVSKNVNEARPIGRKATFLSHFWPLKHCRQAQHRGPVHNKLMIDVEHR